MAEPIVRTFEIDTTKSEQNLRSLGTAFDSADNAGKSLKAQLRELQAQLANTDPQTQKYRELSAAAGELKDKVQDAAQAVGTQAGGAFEKVSGSLGLVTSRIASLDFEGAAEGAKLLAQNITDIKPGDIAKGIQGIGSAFASVGKALLTNPIFLVGAVIAGAIVYAEELLSLVDGVTDADQELLDVQKERAAVAKENFDAISATEQTLKRQGLTEKQITDLKLQALNTAILEQQVVLETNKQQAAAQIAAAERNAKYLQTFLDFVTFPQRKIAEFFEGFVNGAIDILNKLGLGIEKISVTGIFDDVNNFIVKSIFDPEEERKNQEQIIKDSEKALNTLINQRDGILNAEDAKEKARREKAAADRKTAAEKEAADIKAASDKATADRLKNEQEISDLLDKLYQENVKEFEAAEKAKLDAAKLAAEEAEKLRQEELALAAALKEGKIKLATDSLSIISNLAAIYGKGDEKRAKRAFQIQKAVSIAQATIETYKGATAAFASTAANPITIANPAAPFLAAGAAIAAGLANVANIASQQFQGGSSGGGSGGGANPPSFGGGGGADTGAQPATFNPFAAQFVTNRPDQYTPRAYVLAGDVSSQQEVRENVADLARVG
jgi:hypothetical protein